ncbi:uncharacterized protein BXIN_0215 [Babesia sp. Xinjiang]|uniref:uncharacterized protein n=1 Tax=Babesia sp. Xinjiang TaxID=462227 RepID=UPI000A263F9F|nr:uncharacterized protein BXIN_0215 [Babesia sp. Xinjiang]ORM39608.1 hypothetical protein BXIN_0215 [Babesia sp. Xinjiang]
MAIVCENCGERVTATDDDEEITCNVCGVVQLGYSQTVVEGYKSCYTQPTRLRRVKPSTQTSDASEKDDDTETRDFRIIMGIQMVLENLCKTLVNAYGFSSQVELEAKKLWTRYLTLVLENDVPVTNMFSDPLTKGQKYYVDANYIKRTFQIPKNLNMYNIPKRMINVINDMGLTSFEYTTMLGLTILKQRREAKTNHHAYTEWELDVEQSSKKKRKPPPTYDYREVKAYLEDHDMSSNIEQFFDTKVELPQSRNCTPVGFPTYILKSLISHRKLPAYSSVTSQFWSKDVPLHIDQHNPYGIAQMVRYTLNKSISTQMQLLYRHDFIWRLIYTHQNTDPLNGFETFTGESGKTDIIEIINEIRIKPLETKVLISLARKLGLSQNVKKTKDSVKRESFMRADIINVIFNRITEYYFGKNVESDTNTFNLSWLAPKMDLNLVCGLIFATLLRCRYPVVSGDIVRWVMQGRIPLRSSACLLPDSIIRQAYREDRMSKFMRYAPNHQVEMTNNLFINAKVPHNATNLEMLTARLLICGIYGNDGEGESNRPKYNVHGLSRRIVHHLRLPSNVLPVIDMIMKRVATLQTLLKNEDKDLLSEIQMIPLERMNAIYGKGIGAYPAHTFTAACVLAACRMLWPVFHYNPPAYPRREPKDETTGKSKSTMPKNYDLHESFIIRRERFPQTIEFNAGRMKWIVRLDQPADVANSDISKWNEVVINEETLSMEERTFLMEIAKSFKKKQSELENEEKKETTLTQIDPTLHTTMKPPMTENVNDKAPSYLEQPDGSMQRFRTLEFYYDAKSRGYRKAALAALLWLFHHSTDAAVRAIAKYYVDSDMRELRRIAANHALYVQARIFTSSIVRLYTGPACPTGNDSALVAKLQDELFRDLWINIAGLWAGSIVRAIGAHEEDYKEQDERHQHPVAATSTINLEGICNVLLPKLDQFNDIGVITGSLPDNREIYYTITELFKNYPQYTGWSPEKYFELEYYKSLVENQRKQLINSAKEMLATKIVQEQNDTWEHIARAFEKSLHIESQDGQRNEENSSQSYTVADAYDHVMQHMQNRFQNMDNITSTGRQTEVFPWRDYKELGGK